MVKEEKKEEKILMKWSRLSLAQMALSRIIREVSEREGIDFTAFPFALALENYLTDEEKEKVRELKRIIREEIEKKRW